MENRAISDTQITASSQWSSRTAPQEGRLNNKIRFFKQGAWVAAKKDLNQWLQVDLRSYWAITAVATQGRGRWWQWVTKFKIKYSTEGFNFQTYKEPGNSSAKVNFKYHKKTEN